MRAKTLSADHSSTPEGAKTDGSLRLPHKAHWHAPVLKRLDIERTASGHSGKIESAHTTS